MSTGVSVDRISAITLDMFKKVNSVLSILRILILSPLAPLLLLLHIQANFQTISLMLIAMMVGVIWILIERYVSRPLPSDGADINIRSTFQQYAPEHIANVLDVIGYSRIKKLQAVYRPNRNTKVKVNFSQRLYIFFINSIYTFSLMWSLFRFIVVMLGAGAGINPMWLTIFLLISSMLCLILALIQYRAALLEARAVVSWCDKIINCYERRITTATKNQQHQKFWVTRTDADHVSRSRVVFVKNDGDKRIAYSFWQRPDFSKKARWPWLLSGFLIALVVYFLIQFILPYHHVFGQPYPLAVLISLGVGYHVKQLHHRYLEEIIDDFRPLVELFVGAVTVQMVIQTFCLLVLGQSIVVQMHDPNLMAITYVSMMLFGLLSFIYAKFELGLTPTQAFMRLTKKFEEVDINQYKGCSYQEAYDVSIKQSNLVPTKLLPVQALVEQSNVTIQPLNQFF